MSHLHLLPAGSMLPRPPKGYVTRQRTPVEGADLATLDAEAEAAGGVIMRATIKGNTLGRSRQAVEATWYVIPGEAVG